MVSRARAALTPTIAASAGLAMEATMRFHDTLGVGGYSLDEAREGETEVGRYSTPEHVVEHDPEKKELCVYHKTADGKRRLVASFPADGASVRYDDANGTVMISAGEGYPHAGLTTGERSGRYAEVRGTMPSWPSDPRETMGMRNPLDPGEAHKPATDRRGRALYAQDNFVNIDKRRVAETLARHVVRHRQTQELRDLNKRAEDFWQRGIGFNR
jgi:hypothetical protein